ncbi:helix-turn-helix domain-containing protein [Maribellus mangrovi]|uniref:helix-turn-helix domain-containing protein n=1 Tax=Maribellus mangrovi TaxID=3133146 RepID=UPI0030ECD99D
MNTGKRIKELRLKKGMTQEELAFKTEVSARTIQRIENGEVDPRAYTLQMIAKALDVDYSVLVESESFDSQEDLKIKNNTWCGLLHLSGLLPLIAPTLFIWYRKKEKTLEMSNHFMAALSFQLCILAISLVSLWIYQKVNVLTPLIGGLLAGGLVSIINAISVMNGRAYINPFYKCRDNN